MCEVEGDGLHEGLCYGKLRERIVLGLEMV